LKKDNNSGKKSEPTSKRTKSPGPVRRDTKEVLAELVVKLKEKKLYPEIGASQWASGRLWYHRAHGDPTDGARRHRG
jgi:hypothetical protein